MLGHFRALLRAGLLSNLGGDVVVRFSTLKLKLTLPNLRPTLANLKQLWRKMDPHWNSQIPWVAEFLTVGHFVGRGPGWWGAREGGGGWESVKDRRYRTAWAWKIFGTQRTSQKLRKRNHQQPKTKMLKIGNLAEYGFNPCHLGLVTTSMRH